MKNIINKIIYWLPGIALFIMVYRCAGTIIFDNFLILLLTTILCVLLSVCWLSLSFFLFSLVRNLTWHYFGYKKCFWLCFPFVYSRQNGFHLLSTTLTYDSLLFDGFPEDYVEEQGRAYKKEHNKMCIVSERNGMICYSVLNLMLSGLLAVDFAWIIVLLTVWLQTLYMYTMDTPEYKGIYTKYKDYKTNNIVFYVSRAAACQGVLVNELREQVLLCEEQCGDYSRFEFYFYKSFKIQCMYMALSGGVDKELFDHLINKDILSNAKTIVNSAGQEKLELLKVLADSAIINDNQEQKSILNLKFSKLDLEFIQNIGQSLFDIWRHMLKDERYEGEINHMFDQTKQILSDVDIYNRRMYRGYALTWDKLHSCIKKKYIEVNDR